jgi:uncharacterized protein (DUF342 family)
MNKVLIDIREENNQIRCLFKLKDLVTIDEILDKLCELDSDKARVEEELEDLQQDIRDNYKPIPYNEQVGISDKEFI